MSEHARPTLPPGYAWLVQPVYDNLAIVVLRDDEAFMREYVRNASPRTIRRTARKMAKTAWAVAALGGHDE